MAIVSFAYTDFLFAIPFCEEKDYRGAAVVNCNNTPTCNIKGMYPTWVKWAGNVPLDTVFGEATRIVAFLCMPVFMHVILNAFVWGTGLTVAAKAELKKHESAVAMRAAFDRVDTDGSGSIDEVELSEAISAIEAEANEAERAKRVKSEARLSPSKLLKDESPSKLLKDQDDALAYVSERAELARAREAREAPGGSRRECQR